MTQAPAVSTAHTDPGVRVWGHEPDTDTTHTTDIADPFIQSEAITKLLVDHEDRLQTQIVAARPARQDGLAEALLEVRMLRAEIAEILRARS